MIALHYIGGSFFIDLLAVFPFELILNTGAMTKLFRLFRLPRLIKLIDISRFNKLLKSFENKNSDDKTILKQYFILYIYHIFRLIILALMITYFLGTISIFISNELNTQESEDKGNTLLLYFGIDEKTQLQKLITVCYFALTTLSTVGYGDYYPIS